MNLDIWMRENTLTYVWLGSYAVALLVFLVEMMLLRSRRKQAIEQVQLYHEAKEQGE